MSSFLALVIGLLIADSAFADWIEDSDKNSMVVLRSGHFGYSLGSQSFENSVILVATMRHRTGAVCQFDPQTFL